MVLLILAVIWAAVLVPPWYQARRENRPGNSIATFRKQLNVLERATPGRRVLPLDARSRLARPAPGPRARAMARRRDLRRRRRDVFLTLLGAVGLSFVLALFLGGPVWGLHLAVVALFGCYVAMLVRLQQQAAERESKVRYLPTAKTAAPARPEPALLLRRSAN